MGLKEENLFCWPCSGISKLIYVGSWLHYIINLNELHLSYSKLKNKWAGSLRKENMQKGVSGWKSMLTPDIDYHHDLLAHLIMSVARSILDKMHYPANFKKNEITPFVDSPVCDQSIFALLFFQNLFWPFQRI